MSIQSPHLAPPPPPVDTLFRHYLPSPARFPDYPAFVDGLSGRTITSTQLRTDALRLGQGVQRLLPLRQTSDVDPAVALLFSPNSVDFPQIFFGCQSVKVITSLANAGYTANELAHQIRDGQPFVAFVHPSLRVTYLRAIDSLKAEGSHSIPKVYWAVPEREVSAEVAGDVQAYDRLMDNHEQISGFQGVEAQVDEVHDTALLCYSSGTTGLPKGVMTTHHNVNANGLISKSCYPSSMSHGTGSSILGCLPLYHIYGILELGIIPLFNGVPVVILSGFTPQLFFSAIARFRITHAYVVPPIVIHMANSPLADAHDLSSLKWTRSAAAPLGKEVVAKVKARFGNDLIMTQGYGLTESTAVCACQTVEESESYPGSTGTLYPMLEARLLDTDLQDVSSGEAGELCLRGPTVMKGYWNNPTATAASFTPDGWYRTGDIAQMNDNGQIYIVDRLKELIKYNGFQVAPAELEAMLLKHPKIADVAVIGVVSRQRGTELPRAYVVPLETKMGQEAQDALINEIIAWVGENAADHKRLRGGCVLIDAIPKSAAGKILRRNLRLQAQTQVDELDLKANNPAVIRMAKL
ncbi:hypothetical protein QFC21_000190 [Naganishia friedmannii]|uniref:Uncharacterized protein n=1 Tax=Naganishia friedmannii TaxID=89922 RepID=A0ACC2WCL1_9TREE|nr:hypothetical protein QFC21_000190 [Naganishia friedmannii]